MGPDKAIYRPVRHHATVLAWRRSRRYAVLSTPTRLGTTLMHEHVFVLNEEIRLNYPGDWDEETRVADAAAKLNALRQRGCDTIADPTVIGLGRDIRRVKRVGGPHRPQHHRGHRPVHLRRRAVLLPLPGPAERVAAPTR